MNILKKITALFLFALIIFSCKNDDDNFIPGAIVASDDTYTTTLPIASGGSTLGNILDNDTLDAQAASSATVTITATPTGELTISEAGVITILEGTTIGVYTITYTICETNSSSNCDTATVTVTVGQRPFENGILISNEGPFQTGNGSISFIDFDSNTVTNTIFATTNPGQELGNIVQSIGFTDNEAYIVANNSNKITVVDRYTFESSATIENGLFNPRYVAAFGQKAFVSNWGDAFSNADDFVAVIDLATHQVSSTIPVPFGPERVITHGNVLYVAHKGGFGYNNLITVINMETNAIIATITVGDVVDSMQIVGNSLWVLCSGQPSFAPQETPGSLYEIDLATNSINTALTFASTTDHPSDLVKNGTELYFSLNGAVRTVNSQNPVLPGTAFVSGFFYEIEVHQGKLYATDAADFQSDGSLKVFNLGTGIEEQTYSVGIIPGGIYINE